MRDKKGKFIKGSIPWNKNTKGIMKSNSGSFKKGERRSVKTEFTSENSIGEKNINWKGDNVGYNGLHSWIQRKLGKACECKFCKTTKGKIHWASKNYKYERNLEDWVSLCSKCHQKYDRANNWGEATRRFNL